MGNMIGSSPNCRPECLLGSDCPSNQACVNQRCVDPCPGTCASNSDCRVVNHSPVCSCAAGFTGNAFSDCRPTPVVGKMISNARPDVFFFHFYFAEAYPNIFFGLTSWDSLGMSWCCDATLCPFFWRAIGFFVPDKCFFFGDWMRFLDFTVFLYWITTKLRQFQRNFITRNLKLFDDGNFYPLLDCLEVLRLFFRLFGFYECCYSSKTLTQSDWFIYKIVEPNVVQPPSLCDPNPCGTNANCREQNGAINCICPANYVGDPFSSCRPECVLNTDCPRDKGCVNNRCVDPCPGTCGINAVCRVSNHIPVCSCKESHTGDPYGSCRPIPATCKNKFATIVRLRRRLGKKN